MGNSHSHKRPGCTSKVEHWSLIQATPVIGVLQSCSYTRWIKTQRIICGYGDYADFTTCRESRRRCGVLAKPDTTCGRYFVPRFKSKSELLIVEKQKWYVGNFKLPRVPVPDQQWVRHSQHNRNRRECSVVAYFSGLIVVQINTNRYYLSPKFYILDIETSQVVGHFLMFYHCRRWYECYISPNKNRILLRPDSLTRVVALPDNYLLENVCINQNTSYPNLSVGSIPPIFRTHVMTFNAIAGDNRIIMAYQKDLEIRSVETWGIIYGVQNLDLPTNIQQMKSSPLGDFLAVRCIHPVHCKEYSVNVIAVLSFYTLDILFKVDVCGCYWPVSEVINLQVFPYFSPGEASISLMKNCTYHRKVVTYKLPISRLNLQYLCRRAILHLANYRDLSKLPLPKKLVSFLEAKVTVCRDKLYAV